MNPLPAIGAVTALCLFAAAPAAAQMPEAPPPPSDQGSTTKGGMPSSTMSENEMQKMMECHRMPEAESAKDKACAKLMKRYQQEMGNKGPEPQGR